MNWKDIKNLIKKELKEANLTKDDVINLFVELKTQYYNYKDNTRWN